MGESRGAATAGKNAFASQWLVVARRRLAVLEGDNRLHELVKGMGADFASSVSDAALCAVAMRRVGQRLFDITDRFETTVATPDENMASLPAVRKDLASRIAVVADSSMMPRRRAPNQPGSIVFGPKRGARPGHQLLLGRCQALDDPSVLLRPPRRTLDAFVAIWRVAQAAADCVLLIGAGPAQTWALPPHEAPRPTRALAS